MRGVRHSGHGPARADGKGVVVAMAREGGGQQVAGGGDCGLRRKTSRDQGALMSGIWMWMQVPWDTGLAV